MTIRNILVIKMRYLGDVLIATPVFTTLKHHHPGATITALVEKGAAPVLAHHPAVDRIITLDRMAGPAARARHYWRLVGELRQLRPDLTLALTDNRLSAFFSFASGAERRLGFQSPKRQHRPRDRFYTDLVPVPGTCHIVTQQLAMTDYLGFASPHQNLSLFWDREAEASGQAVAKAAGLSPGEDYAVVHASSPSRHKLWKGEGFASLIDHLWTIHNLRTVLVAGPVREELAFLASIQSRCSSKPVNLGGRLTIPQLAALLARGRLFIGIDSGPMHMAVAVNTPVIAIFGPSRSYRWGPWGEGHRVIQKTWDCVPCGKKGCRGEGVSRCLDELTIAEVLAAVDVKLAEIASARG